MLAFPLGVLLTLRIATSLDAHFFSPGAHLVVVTAIAACATLIAVAAVINARSTSHPGSAHLGIGSAGMGILMLGHGITTPGVLSQPPNLWVSRFPHLALALFAVTLFLAARGVGTRPNRWVGTHPTAFVGLCMAGIASLTLVIGLDPTLGPEPSWEEAAMDVISAIAIGLSIVGVVTHWRRWLLGKDVVQLALAFAAAMTIAAVTSLQHGQFQQLSWWDYHAYLLGGFGCAVFAIRSRAGRHRRVGDALKDAFSDDPIAHITNGYPDVLLQLARAVEVKDPYTHGHSARTAHTAIELGICMGLPPDQLRVIARGAYLHDLGKIAIPDHILNKPSGLTAEERTVIETHPCLGYEMASAAPELREALDVIRHHHERFDGTGYPDGLAGEAIPVEARVVTVADVWDALTSDRSYRPGWSPSEALAHIEAGRGSHFDPRVVDAVVQLAVDLGVPRRSDGGDVGAAWDAGQSCHQASTDAELVPA